ncbi:acetyl-CoA synthetase-like protein [Anaeromyces robustus]|uniref:Acetyl-CoA synthetase-like protein n=1 Tax=Anaeromyces robustus TaxID=1754192 RepID=A0A1Y1W059_9FUNG|nr:acetyl-CoA synthetase-like protein [Anaeromyces robustus]|eukprot:ORX66665.1 acetyl-CoA synthetase-like protein [Anaeromyces robustus]
MGVINNKKILFDFNNNKYSYFSKLYHLEFNKLVKDNPDKIAVIFEDNFFTYQQIDEKSNSLAHFLRNYGVNRNDIVPLIFEKSVYSIIASLAVMKAGAAFIFIDPEYPKSRIQFIVNEVKAKIILKYLYTSENIENEKFSDFDSVNIYDIKGHNFDENIKEINNINESNDICCSFLTSGTTGRPKAVLITHDNIINFLLFSLTYNGTESIYGSYNYILGFAKETFILSLMDMFYPLIHGKTLILCNNEQYNNPKLLGDIINRYKIDFIFSTHTRIENYLYNESFRNSLNNVKIFTFCGEKPSAKFLKNLIKYTKANIYIDYGCTESTGTASVGSINREDIINDKPITIGKPGCNINIYILNEKLEPVDIGEEGEIYISGHGISKGYHNQENLQNKYFIDCPFFSSQNEEKEKNKNCSNRFEYQNKMYKTGDIAKWTEKGEIIYIGRTDFQVKIRGQRVELEEIERCVKEIEGINNSVVLIKNIENKNEIEKDNNEANKCLVCYYIRNKNDKNNEKIISKKEIRDKLRETLPSYMIPNFFIEIDDIPVDYNGKLDRFALPEPNFNEVIHKKEGNEFEDFIPVSTDTEKIILKIFSKVLNKKEEYISKMDDFYDLGGNSLMATRISAEIEKLFYIKISIIDILKYSTISSISQFIDKMKITNEKSSIIKRYNKKEFPFLIPSDDKDKFNLNILNSVRNDIHIFCKLKEDINIEKLIKAIQEVFNRHEILKSVLFEKKINGKNHIYCRVIEDAQLVIEKYTIENFHTFLRKFDITKDLLIRVGLIDDKVLLLDMEHSICDGFSVDEFIYEMTEIYNGIKLEPLPIQYSDYAISFNSMDEIENLETRKYYEEMFSKPVELINLPIKKSDKEIKLSFEYEVLNYKTSIKTFNSINELSKKYKLSQSVLFLVIYGVVLSYYTGQKRIYSSIINFGRTNYYTKNLIGFMVKVLPIVLDIDYNKNHENKDKNLNQSSSTNTLINLIKSQTKIILNIISNEIPYNTIGKLNLPVTNSLYKYDPYDMFNRINYNEDNKNNNSSKNIENKNITKIVNYKEIYEMYRREDLINSFIEPKGFESHYNIRFLITENIDNYKVELSYNPNIYDDNLIKDILNSIKIILENKENFEKNIEDIYELIDKNTKYNISNCENESELENSKIKEDSNFEKVDNNIIFIKDNNDNNNDLFSENKKTSQENKTIKNNIKNIIKHLGWIKSKNDNRNNIE